MKPRLVLFRWIRPNLPKYIHFHLGHQEKCLSHFFDLVVVSEDCDYAQICDRYKPDLTIFESGVYAGPRRVRNTRAFPDVPKLGLLNADAYCYSRSVFLSDMDRWGIDTYVTISASMAEYTPDIADRLFVWPNFIDPEVFHDYGETKVIPVLFTGSQAIHYPWRNRVSQVVSPKYPTLTSPHFGWLNSREAAQMLHGEKYARMINSSFVVPACGSISKDIVRKHFEVPGCNSCLVTEKSEALTEAGFADMQNCVFADESDVLDKLEYLFRNPDALEKISRSGYELVHARHTYRSRDQILQWLMLHSSLKPGYRIIQNGPFGSLAAVDRNSGTLSTHAISRGVDRELLGKAHACLRAHNFDEAESLYLRCLNYYTMPEAFLGLALCSLYKGNPAKALEYIADPITRALGTYCSADPDPIEWTCYIIALLCQGKIDEAARRARQFPWLHHTELERCRRIINALRPPVDHSARHNWTITRRSVHQFPDRTMESWMREIYEMLNACGQISLVEQLRKSTNTILSKDPAPQEDRNADLNPDRESGSVLPLVPRSFRQGLAAKAQRLTKKAVGLFKAVSGRDGMEFAHVVEKYARSEFVRNALVVGARNRWLYTGALLSAAGRSPQLPVVFCISPERLSAIHQRTAVVIESAAISKAKEDAGIERFDLVLVDGPFADKDLIRDEILEAKTILINQVNSHERLNLLRAILSSDVYQLVSHNSSVLEGYAVFVRQSSDVIEGVHDETVAVNMKQEPGTV